ncbi:hypothetical protein ACH4SP_40040 [Streptomyces sp. NPDC021093]|uniref:hypothetical protein n=1 Tax=Streptomyces sp. NPDC021093 TaxID=3365112 RepID=UPI0037B3F03F
MTTDSRFAHAYFVNSGTGPVYLGGPDRDESLLGHPRQKPPRAQAEDELTLLRSHFVEPRGFGEACEVLAERRTVLLDCRPGDGRSATAQMLLGSFLPRSRTLRKVSPDEEESPDCLLLDPSTVDDGDRLWLDLSSADPARWERAVSELSTFRRALHDRDAALVVVLPDRRDDFIGSAPGSMRCRISRLPGMETDIVRKHLRTAGHDVRLADRPPDEVAACLAGEMALDRVAGLAQELCRCLSRGLPAAASWARALALVAPTGAAADQFDDVRKGGPRTLLLATAMLHEARADAVHRGTALLLDATHPETEVRALLERKPFKERLRQVHAAVDEDGRVRFTGGSDALARSHLRTNFPGLREPLRAWVEKAVSLPELSPDERAALVRRFVEHSLAADRPEDLETLVVRWVKPIQGVRDHPRLQAAAHTLQQAVEDERHGSHFLRQVLEWAVRSQLSPQFRQVLVDVCAQGIAVHRPDAALVRLHHLARHEGDPGRAHRALVRLVEDDHRLLRLLLYRIARSSSCPPPADPGIFLALSAPGPLLDRGGRPRPLLAETQVREHLEDCWTAVLASRPTTEWTPRATDWLRAACGESPYTEGLLDVLVAACRKRGDLLGRLYNSARSIAVHHPTTPRAVELPDLLYRKIVLAQRSRTTPSREDTAP